MEESLISIVKTCSTVAAGVFGALALLTKYKDDSGRITKWGKTALAGVILSTTLSLVLNELEASRAKESARKAEAQAEATVESLGNILTAARETLRQQGESAGATRGIASAMGVALQQQQESLSRTQDLAADMSKTLTTQRTLLASQARVQRQVVRAYCPLEPMSLFYELEYSMDDPVLSDYVKRVRSDIVRYLKEARAISGAPTSEDLRDEKDGFVLKNLPQQEWAPGNAPEEEEAEDVLLEDATLFAFSLPEQESAIEFSCVPPYLQHMFRRLPLKGPVEQKIELIADFSRGVILKSVWCVSPTRSGTDTLAMSSIDLIGRTMTWKPLLTPHPRRRLVRFALNFPNDYAEDFRYAEVPQGVYEIAITVDHVGLREILADIESQP